jgi:shikimate kinase
MGSGATDQAPLVLPALGERPLFLIGMMATGKSTVGRLLAERLGRPFVDLDERIEQWAGATVPEIFASEGEAGFRAHEAAALGALLDGGELVVAVGGGAPCFGDNLARMLAAGTVVCLTADAEEIAARVGDARSRPLLAGAADRRAVIRRLLDERAPFYRRAPHVVDTTGQRPSQVLARLIERLA